MTRFLDTKTKVPPSGFKDGDSGNVESSDEAIPLPDIKEARRKKEAEELARLEEERLKEKRKIKRGDREAFTKVSQ